MAEHARTNSAWLMLVFTIRLQQVKVFRQRFQSAPPLIANASLETECCFDARESEYAISMPVSLLLSHTEGCVLPLRH